MNNPEDHKDDNDRKDITDNTDQSYAITPIKQKTLPALLAKGVILILGFLCLFLVIEGLLDWGVGLVLVLICVAAMIAVDSLFLYLFRCPTCKVRCKPHPLRWYNLSAGEAVTLRCDRCQIAWDPGIRGGDIDG